MCNKDDDIPEDNGNTGNNGNNNEPKLNPEDTWLYFNESRSLVVSYAGNTRDLFEKWIATKLDPAYSGLNITANKHFFTWSFENTGNTRFLSNSLNPGGKEKMDIFIDGFSDTPGPGTYTGFNCWYDVYTASGAKLDSTKMAVSDTLHITRMVFFESVGAIEDRYKMSGTATFNIAYWPGGAPSAEIYPIHCTFNNVIIRFHK